LGSYENLLFETPTAILTAAKSRRMMMMEVDDIGRIICIDIAIPAVLQLIRRLYIAIAVDITILSPSYHHHIIIIIIIIVDTTSNDSNIATVYFYIHRHHIYLSKQLD